MATAAQRVEMAWQDFPATMEILPVMGDRLIDYYRDELNRQKVGASGRLGKNLSFRIKPGRGPSFQIILKISNYWKWVEDGRPPGKRPPVKAILQWIKTKPILPRPAKGGDLPTEKTLAFLIARSIGRKGTKPHPVMQNATQRVIDEFTDQLSIALGKDIGQFLITEITANI